MASAVARSILFFACIASTTHAASESLQRTGLSISLSRSQARVEAMHQVFFRSEQTRANSMDGMMKSMSTEKAVKVLMGRNLTSPALLQILHMAHGEQMKLQAHKTDPVAGARKLVNDMIYEAMLKYDSEIQRCQGYYSGKCAAMEELRGQIASANYVAANSRALISDAQSTIGICEVHIPQRKYERQQHILGCKHELHLKNERLKILEGDIKVLGNILNMTKCKATFMQGLVQEGKISLLKKCEDPCTNRSFVTFAHDDLLQQIGQLQSATTHSLLQENFADIAGVEQVPATQLLQLTNQTAPRTEVPGNPCTDPNAGAPGEMVRSKRGKKCTIPPGDDCLRLQERFVLIQASVEDEKEELLDEIDMFNHYCEETKNTLDTQIQDDKQLLMDSQTKLAEATEKEAAAGEDGRTTAKYHEELDTELTKEMKTCTNNYIAAESEICALKKIRGEMYKMQGSGDLKKNPFFVDCEVSQWDPQMCSAKCGGGMQVATRNILTHQNGGADCLPLTMQKACNENPCPVNCKLEDWSGWSKCSADCGGGVRQRLREVITAAAHGGKPCDQSVEEQQCNVQSCEKDCVLTKWTKWSTCSKDCDGGTMKRVKFIKSKAEGEGKCPTAWSLKRLNYKACNEDPCKLTPQQMAQHCTKPLDIILVIDGSGSLGQKGWDAEKKAAKGFVQAFADSGANVAISLIVYSGPYYWWAAWVCMYSRYYQKNEYLLERVCKVNKVLDFTTDLAQVSAKIKGLTWPRGSTLTSLALMTAKAELPLGRKDAKSNVIVFTDGRPMSYRRTWMASHQLRKSARLMWVPVTRYAPLKYIKGWATRRWQENVVVVKEFKDLEKDDMIVHMIANMCPKVEPTLYFGKRDETAVRR